MQYFVIKNYFVDQIIEIPLIILEILIIITNILIVILRFGDKYINEHKPWDKSLSNNRKSQRVAQAINILKNVAELLKPFLPETSDKILGAILRENDKSVTVTKIPSLFPRLQ